jgi:tripartite ATP-independent transporter DctM subunit
VVLVLLGGVLNVPAGDLFRAALLPSGLLVLLYLAYVFVFSKFYPEKVGVLTDEEFDKFAKMSAFSLFRALFLPVFLIAAVLGSILAGIATPTEAAGIGAFLSVLLAFFQKGINLKLLQATGAETVRLSGMIFLILIGASCFGLAFRGVEGDVLLSSFLSEQQVGKNEFLVFFMLMVFAAGFFIDFVEIIFIFLPVVAPVLQKYGFDMVWVGVLLCINLQTSFLTPPFGFSLFYLKGVAGETVKTKEMYAGIIPYVIMQVLLMLIYGLFF